VYLTAHVSFPSKYMAVVLQSFTVDAFHLLVDTDFIY